MDPPWSNRGQQLQRRSQEEGAGSFPLRVRLRFEQRQQHDTLHHQTPQGHVVATAAVLDERGNEITEYHRCRVAFPTARRPRLIPNLSRRLEVMIWENLHLIASVLTERLSSGGRARARRMMQYLEIGVETNQLNGGRRTWSLAVCDELGEGTRLGTVTVRLFHSDNAGERQQRADVDGEVRDWPPPLD